MNTGYVVRGRGKATGAVVEADVGRRPYEGHVKRNFVGGKGATATGIMQAWNEREASVHGE